MNVVIQRDGCIGCGVCCDVCPELFRMADDGLAEVIADADPEKAGCAHEAAESCPVSVISITGLE